MTLKNSAQLTLSLKLEDEANFENFIDFGLNAEILSELKGKAPMIFLWSAVGAGRTHLLQSVCHRAIMRKEPSIYVPLSNTENFSPEVLLGIDAINTICLDDIHTIQQKPDWEDALFTLYNKVIRSESRLIISANQSPQELKLTLADLQSRLSALPVFKLSKLDDKGQMAVLRHRANSRGIALNDSVAEFILRRAKRSTHDIISVLDVLDTISLKEKRRITIPLIKEAMNW
ncbi:MAG: DnaA regulatory inactivator Hda [Gammaproteobacteria bacterium]|nr:DnaA regulatory inactivator Hda [Gammaproteobacteria bacterium]